MPHISWLTRRGQQVLLLGFSDCPAGRMKQVVRKVQQVITQERGSVLVLADFTGTEFTRKAVTRIKEATLIDGPYVRRAVWVGTEAFPEVWFNAITNCSQRQLRRLRSREEAMEFCREEMWPKHRFLIPAPSNRIRSRRRCRGLLASAS